MTNESLVFLTVRGTALAKSPEAACRLHNETAGSPAGVEAARALGDLSHKVYVPVPNMGAQPDELLFLDVWTSAEGLGQFFSDPQVQQMAAKLFSARDGAVWMPAQGAFGFHLPSPMSKPERYLGVIRGAVASPESAIETFRTTLAPKLPSARRRGQLSHQLYVGLPMPGRPSEPEIIGIDEWCDAAGMGEHYGEIGPIYGVFKGKPQSSVWRPAQGGVWSEW